LTNLQRVLILKLFSEGHSSKEINEKFLVKIYQDLKDNFIIINYITINKEKNNFWKSIRSISQKIFNRK